MTCKCHASDLYANLADCPACGHRSYDPGVGCERRDCGRVTVADRARAEGWRVGEPCTCDTSRPVIVGGSGFALPQLMCAGCYREAA